MGDSKGLVKFEFEGHEILAVQDNEHGQLWRANDICEALGYSNSRKAVADHVHSDDVTKRDVIDSLGRTQLANFVTESGLYALIFGSEQERAKRFKRWLTSEVLPAIRKTGRYETKARKQSSLLSTTRAQLSIIDAMAAAVAAVPGMQADGVAVLKLNAIGSTFGVDPEPFRRALPSRPVKATLNATQVGMLIEVSAREANRRLLTAGFIRKNEAGEWELTEKGTTLGESFRFARNGHDGFEIRWRPEVADAIVDVVPAVEVLS